MIEHQLKCFSNDLINRTMGPLYPGSVVTLIAEIGTYSDIFLVDFLKNASAGERSVYFSVDEPPIRLVGKIGCFWKNVDAALSNGSLMVFDLSLPRDDVYRSNQMKDWIINVSSPCRPSDVLSMFDSKFGEATRGKDLKLRMGFDSASSYALLAGEANAGYFFREFISMARTFDDTLLVKVHPEMQNKNFVRAMEAQSDIILKLRKHKGNTTLMIKKGFEPEYLYRPFKYEIEKEKILISGVTGDK